MQLFLYPYQQLLNIYFCNLGTIINIPLIRLLLYYNTTYVNPDTILFQRLILG